MLLRLVVTSLLLGVTIVVQLQVTPDVASHAVFPLYVLIGTTFLLSIFYSIYLILVPDLWALSVLQVMVDLVYGTILIHFTGGATSVFTLLYIFPIITSGILHFRRLALVTASAASILFGLLIDLHFYGVLPQSEWPWVIPWGANAPFYIVWILVVHITSFFLVAIVSSSFAEQLQRARASLSMTEKDLEELSDLHTSIVHSIPSGIVTSDAEDTISFVNAAGAAILRAPPERIIGAPLDQIFPVARNLGTRSNGGQETFLTVRQAGGEQLFIELLTSDLHGSGGTQLGRLVVFQDVTRIRKMEERAKISEQQAAFVRMAAAMAHEIRNPLASLRGAAEMLSQDAAAAEFEPRLLGIVIRESDRLNALLCDFLTLVGTRKTNKVRLMLNELIEEIIELFSREQHVGKTISLETLIHKGVEIEGEPSRLKQAMWNLVINAREAIENHGVIRVVLESHVDSQQAVLTIQDSGPGIPPELMDRIFQPFTTTKEKGTGLGLSMALAIVEEHGGTIDVRSSPGAGSLFTIRLPLACADVGEGKGEH
ncbi:MAG: PAS domain-containing protein [Desulfomonile tiedjei]|nr:PAS domain-containing protein [Desulfomonile tiedjei]